MEVKNCFSYFKNGNDLESILKKLMIEYEKNYIYDCFFYWIQKYMATSPIILHNYLYKSGDLTSVCGNFAQFCFSRNISLDKDKTIDSFYDHDLILDEIIKNKLMALKQRENINLLGFGLGNGDYEKSIENFFIKNRIAKSVKLFGFDPYASKVKNIEYLTKNSKKRMPQFDCLIARWALHHVEPADRWTDFIDCMKQCNPGAIIIIAEHGFLTTKNHAEIENPKFYRLLNATFDVVANIGIRPSWFLENSDQIGDHFFIDYLTERDFANIKTAAERPLRQEIYHIGPSFPNQTICFLET